MVFSVGERGYGDPVLRIKVAETDFQRSEEKSLSILETVTVLIYHRAPIIYELRQAHGAGFQLDQVAQDVRDESRTGFGANDG